jgi:hypothetical protein
MPPKRATAVKKVAKTRRTPRTKLKESQSKVEDKETAKTETPADIFATFSTDVVLNEGLNIIRSLGNGKYEVVSLDTVSQNAIGSVEAADLIKSVPEREVALQISKQQWEAAILKCDVAVRITSRYFFFVTLEGRST